ncbi:putative rRNA pseudouridine synthase [Methanolinea mesophila]|uniref:RNA-guided pseudouridylation complex pseudouridine synthase subunit Cbf5 n=1 Tax=Methanolinea mesophila TaxID=547055 RepID=UPI001AEA124F|nr:RNA-guided pseudouridylation complex pseudouridine synthase subunit Cbf5 [Methanolinea mesophila]MBP1928555.1 putative rRNA pseudouridine synthase [Methanolinea mesophila]
MNVHRGWDFGDPGILVVDKPRGPSSHQVTAWVGEILGTSHVGHSGTLDPMVSGVLVVMLGNAVRLAPLLLQEEKEYICLARLHGDASREEIARVAGEFTGRVYQRPPVRSAVARSLRIRTIYELEILDVEGRLVLMRVRCDAGTYLRSLCHDMGLALGTGGQMQELRRSRSGQFSVDDACTLQDLKDAAVLAREGAISGLRKFIRPVEAAVLPLPRVIVRDTAVDAICHGASLACPGILSFEGGFRKGEMVAVMTIKEELVCLGQALVSSKVCQPGGNGLVVASRTVFMKPGTYPRGWTSHPPQSGPV